MVHPLSRNTRRYYLIFLTLVFVILTPVLIFYAIGYRLTDSFIISRTGGLYIATNQSGTKVYVNDELVKETSIFQKNVLVQNLKPGTFTIRTEKDSLTSWVKELQVYPETITEAHSFMIPGEPLLLEILPFFDNEGTPTTTPLSLTKTDNRKNPDFIDTSSLFTATSTRATSTPDIK